MELTLKDRKLINNGGIPELEQRLEDKIASTAIPLGGTTGLSTLTDRKYINNLPKYSVGKVVKSINAWGNKDNAMFGSNAGAVMSAAPAAIDFVGSIASGTKYNKTADDLLQDVGSAEGNIGGVSYQTQNEINAQEVAAQEHAENKANTIGLMGKGASLGASVGSIAGPVGGLIGGAVGAIGGLVGGLFGGGKRHAAMRRRIAEAQDKALRQNDFSRNGALTSVLQLNYAREYGDTESQSLYGFKDGKESEINPATGMTIKNYTIETSHGKQKGPQNSWVEKDEVLWDPVGDPLGLNMHVVDHGPNDSARSYLTDTDVVFTKKNDISKMALANAGNPIGLQALMNEQSNMKKGRQNKGFFAAKNGKLPGFSIGKWGVPEWANFTGNIIPMIATGAEYLRSKSEPLGSYTATHSNPNAGIASNMMSQRRYNPYPAYRNVWDLYAKNNYASNNSGLSSSQLNLLRTTNYANTLDNIYKINDHAQLMNNQYLGENAEFLDNQGRFNTQLRQADDVKHDDTYVRSHGAADLRNSTLLSQFGNLSQNFTKGVSDLWVIRKMLDYFDQEENTKRKNRNTKYRLNAPAVVNDKNMFRYISGINDLSLADGENLFRESALRALQKPMTSAQRIAAELKRYENNIANLDLSMPTFAFPSLISKKSRKKSIKRK